MPKPTFAISTHLPAAEAGEHPRESTVYLAGGEITRVAPGRDPGADLAVEGTLVPGLIDLQVNGAYGHDFTLDASTIPAVAARLPETGVTAFLPTIITSAFDAYPARLREAEAALRDSQSGRSAGAAMLGVHLEGPYLNPLRKGAHPPACIRAVNVEEIRAWADPAVTRIVTLAPELPGALEAIRALRAAGILVSAGHSNADFVQAQAGFQAGVGWGTHLYNAMSPLQHREPGLIGALLVSPIPCGLIVDGIHSHPAMVQLAWKAKGTQGITLVTDCMAAMGMAQGRYALGAHTVIVDATSARLEDGTLAGSILKMDEALRNMMAFSGCSLADAVTMASTNPAHLLGLARKGAIAPGCDADLVALSPENTVTHTFIAGELVYTRPGA